MCPALAQCWGERSDNVDHAMMPPGHHQTTPAPASPPALHWLHPDLSSASGKINNNPPARNKYFCWEKWLNLTIIMTRVRLHSIKKNMHSCAMKISRIILPKIGRLCKKIFFILKWPHSQRGESASAAIRLRQRPHLIQRQPHLE